MPKGRRPRPLPTTRGLPRTNTSVSEQSERVTALAVPTHVRGTRRRARALTALQARLSEATIAEAESLDRPPDRLVFIAEGNTIDESVFRTIFDCDRAGIPVALLADSGRLIPRNKLRLTSFEHSTRRAFATVETLRDRRTNPRAFG